MDLTIRPRRLRGDDSIRRLIRETRLSPQSLIYPIFIDENIKDKAPISSMEGQYRWGLDSLPKIVEKALEAGISRGLLFGIPKTKDGQGSEAFNDKGIIQEGIREIKKRFPEFYVITDVCMCEYTDHGHCGIIKGYTVDNDPTLELLSREALSHVRAGADMVAPSDMMDGRIGHMRKSLDDAGFSSTPIMAYSAKYASGFYGPFREAADSAPAFGDRRSYQMDYHNSREAIKECALDVAEGADILMVKPALSYLDIISKCRDEFRLPIAAYSVSGEYSMIKAAAKAGYINEYALMCESAVSIFRAGADILISYYAMELAGAIRKGDIG